MTRKLHFFSFWQVGLTAVFVSYRILQQLRFGERMLCRSWFYCASVTHSKARSAATSSASFCASAASCSCLMLQKFPPLERLHNSGNPF